MNVKAKADPEDPQEKAARLAEQARADAALVDSTATTVTDEDRRRLRLYGAQPTSAGTGGTSGQYVTTAGFGPLASGMGAGSGPATPGSVGSAGGGGGGNRGSIPGRVSLQ